MLRWLVVPIVLVTVAALALGTAGCGGATGEAEAEPTPPPSPSAAPSPPPAEATRCVRVAPFIVAAIKEGLQSDLSLGRAQAVRSSDFKRIYFVSAELRGPGFEDGDVATWMTNRIDDYGVIYSADSLTSEFSDWGRFPDGGIGDDGYDESRECVR